MANYSNSIHFSQDPHALQIAYYDEVELCNPLGIHVNLAA